MATVHTFTSFRTPSFGFWIAFIILLFMSYEMFIDEDPKREPKEYPSTLIESDTIMPKRPKAQRFDADVFF